MNGAEMREALSRFRPGNAIASETAPGDWVVRELTDEEKRHRNEMVTVTFQSRADLAETLTDDDLLELGRFVVKVTAEARA